MINSIVVYDYRPRSESSSHCPTPVVAKPGQARQACLRIFFPQRWFVCQSIGSRYIGHYYWVSVFLSGLRFGVVRLDDDDAYIGLAWKIRFPGIARYWTGDSILLQGKESSRRPMGILLNNFKLGLGCSSHEEAVMNIKIQHFSQSRPFFGKSLSNGKFKASSGSLLAKPCTVRAKYYATAQTKKARSLALRHLQRQETRTT